MNKMHGFRVMFVLAFTGAAFIGAAFIGTVFAGCEELGSGESAPPEPGVPPEVVDKENRSIKVKFGITTEGAEGVTDTFEALHDYVQWGDLENGDDIRVGDWIDLEGGLHVAAYEGYGLIGEDTPQENIDFGGEKGTLLRLIVVGINSFKPGRGTVNGGSTTVNGDSNGQYRAGESPDGVPSHVVFQFKNVPVVRRMNPTMTNAGGYRDSETRTYVRVNFFDGLKNAGVPEWVLWAPTRMVSVKSAEGSNEISDLLWLPTEREMFHEGRSYNNNGLKEGPYSDEDETAANQARLEYYSGEEDQSTSTHGVSNSKRIKYNSGGDARTYWLASPEEAWDSSFCTVIEEGTNGATGADFNPDMGRNGEGVAPAFCVR